MLSGTKITSIAGDVIKAMLKDSKLEAASIDEVVFGNVLQAGLGQNPVRQAAFAAKIPVNGRVKTGQRWALQNRPVKFPFI